MASPWVRAMPVSAPPSGIPCPSRRQYRPAYSRSWEPAWGFAVGWLKIVEQHMQRPVPYTDIMIDPTKAVEVKHWAKDLQVETYELRAAINMVGPSLSGLRRFFGKSADIVSLATRRADNKARKAPPPWSAFPNLGDEGRRVTGIAYPPPGQTSRRGKPLRRYGPRHKPA
jgi:hypothetical protein